MPSIATFERWRQAVAAPARSSAVPRPLRRCIPRGGKPAVAAADANAPPTPPPHRRSARAPAVAAPEGNDENDENDDTPAGYIVRPGSRGVRAGGRGRRAYRNVISAPDPAAERAAVAAAVALAAAAAAAEAAATPAQEDKDDDEEWAEEEEDANDRFLVAPQRTSRPRIPPHLAGLARDSGRPWQRAEIWRLLAATAAGDGGDGGGGGGDSNGSASYPAAPSLYARMTAPRLKRVLDARVACETDARRLLEEARWQRERAEGWGRLAASSPAAAASAALPGGPRLLDFTVRTGLAEVANLASECGAAEARLAALAEAAASYRDGAYSRRHAPALKGLLRRVRAFCDHYRESTAPALERALSGVQARARAQRADPEGWGGGTGGRRRTPPPPPLPPPPARLLPEGWLPPPLPRAEEAVAWRYPPAEYVVFRRKGEKGARARAHALPPAMREREERAAAEASRRAARRAFGDGTGTAAATTTGGDGGGGGFFDD